jgi:hypothetical protein
MKEHAPHDVVQGGSLEVLSQRHGAIELLFGCYVAQHGGAFKLAAGFVGYNAPGRE